jgi:GDP-L-fucose synthase
MNKILITGGNGLMGNAFRSLEDTTEDTMIFVSRDDADLVVSTQVDDLFCKHSADYVIHAAARVGGIGKNLASPAEQFYCNIMMNTNVIEGAYRRNVKKLLAFSSACAFPGDLLVQSEDKLHEGEPYPAHKSYAYSKRMVDIQIEAYNQQYGTSYSTIIPGNIFGEHDNFNLEDGHVIPALIHKCYLAKLNKTPLKVWGTGEASREFIYSVDVAKACLEMLYKDQPDKLIVSGKLFKIKEIVALVCQAFDYYNVEWETDKPEGQMFRSSDKTVFKETLTDITEAINKTCKWFSDNYEDARK